MFDMPKKKYIDPWLITTDEDKERTFPLNWLADLAPLMERIGDAHYVLLGEATHGTHEFYTWRSAITKKLIREKGFNIIAVEGDWPDCYKVNRYIKGFDESDKSTTDILKTFNRWPTWMWANWEIVALIDWLEDHNRKLRRDEKQGSMVSTSTVFGNP
jgi:erythromycin esterase-like protein